jgi:predicted component of type VI protein secretion system
VNRRLEDRIRDLCYGALMAPSKDEARRFLEKLQAALQEHEQRLKRVAVLKLMRKDDGFQERRAA